MRFSHFVLVATVTFVASTSTLAAGIDSTHTTGLISTDSVPQSRNTRNANRFLRADTTVDNEEERAVTLSKPAKVTGVEKLTKYLNQKTLDFWLWQNKHPKEVFGILGLKPKGPKDMAFKRRSYKYYTQYLAMRRSSRFPLYRLLILAYNNHYS